MDSPPAQADTISKYFDLIWVPNSAKLAHDAKGMGYIPYYLFNKNSAQFGTEEELKRMSRMPISEPRKIWNVDSTPSTTTAA
ncbi:MAG: hypothetical protein PUF37_05950 [Prevotellaceae bacterium]|nr:hypothetical protein [Prevotellaceae bacterium]